MKVRVEVSARHVHLCQKDLESLFGPGYELKIKRFLSQPGQFLSEEKVNIKINDKKIANVSVLGPARRETQVEISLTDARKLRTDVPIRESGDIVDSPGCILESSRGKIIIEKGLIVAKRHIHVNSNDNAAQIFKNGEECNLKVETKDRSIIFCKTVVRISDNFKFAAHLDTDEANAAGISGETFGEIIKL